MPHGNRPGDELGGRYTLVDLLSESRGGRFWRARDRVLARHVALHVISAQDERAPGLLDAARRSATVQDRRMLRVLDADERDGLVYVVNEWGVGASLDILLADQPLTPRRAAWIVSEVADAMAAAHAREVAHGHLVPENVLVDHVGSVRIIGLAVDAALRGVGPGRIEDDVVDLVGLLYSGLTGRWAGHAYSEVEPAPTEGDGLLRPRQVRAGIPRVLDQLCDEVLDTAHRGILNGRHDTAPHDAAGMAALLQQFVGDPLEMAAAEAALGHGSPPAVQLTGHGGAPAWPRAREDDQAAEDGEQEEQAADAADEGDGGTRRVAAVDPDPDPTGEEPAEDATRDVPVAPDGSDDSVDPDDPDAPDDPDDSVHWDAPDAPDAPDDSEPTLTVSLAGDAQGGPGDEDAADEDPADEDPADEDPGALTDVPTQAGIPIFRNDTDEVDWVSKQQERPPPPPPLEAPPERPLFAPDPPDGQPQRRPRSGPPGRVEDDSWPWGTGSGVAATGTGAVFDEPTDSQRGPVPGRRWFRLAMVIGVASLALLLVVFVGDLLRGGQPLGVGPAPEETPSASSDDSSGAAPSPVTGLDVRSLDPQGDGEENGADAAKVVDGDRGTTWQTSTYFQQLGPQGLKTGVGLVVDLGRTTAVREVDLRLVGSPTTTQLYLTDEDPSDVDGLDPVGEIEADGPKGSAELSGQESGRYLVLWLTSLPAVDGGFRGEVGEVVVRS